MSAHSGTAAPPKRAALETLAAWICALAVVLGPGPVVRAEPSASVEQSAAGHFERGVEFYRDGNLEAALVEFERAYELIPNYRLLFNLAQIQVERHEYAAALSLFEKYLQEGGAQVPEARRIEAQQEIIKLRARVAHLSVESNVEGAKVFVNDAPAATLPLAGPLPINPGRCEVRLEKSGYSPAVKRIKVAGGESLKLNLTLVAAGRAAAGDLPPSQLDAPSVSYTPLWISSGATLALGGATLAFGVTARAADRDLDAALDRFPANEREIDDARSQLKLYSALTDTFAVASVIALGFAVYFLIVPPKRARANSAPAGLRILPSQRGAALHATF